MVKSTATTIPKLATSAKNVLYVVLAIRFALNQKLGNLYMNTLELKRAEATRLQKEIDNIDHAKNAFPDLVCEIDRWKTERWGAKSANDLVTDVEFRHDCGCCSDSPLYAICSFTNDEGFKIHSSPVRFTIGEQSPMTYHDCPHAGWKDKIKNAGLSDKIIKKIETYFEVQNAKVDELLEEDGE